MVVVVGPYVSSRGRMFGHVSSAGVICHSRMLCVVDGWCSLSMGGVLSMGCVVKVGYDALRVVDGIPIVRGCQW